MCCAWRPRETKPSSSSTASCSRRSPVSRPRAGRRLGLIGCSPSDTSAAVQFDNLHRLRTGRAGVRPSPKAMPPFGQLRWQRSVLKCPAPKDPLFADHFDTLQTSWGAFENYKVDNGEFLITPPAGYNTSALNTASLYDDVDLCVEMKMRAPVEQGTCGSLIIWAEDLRQLLFVPGLERWAGLVLASAARQMAEPDPLADRRWLEHGRRCRQPVAGDDQGRTAKLFINGKLFKAVKASLRQAVRKSGMLACAGEKQAAAVSFDNLVVAARRGAGASRMWRLRRRQRKEMLPTAVMPGARSPTAVDTGGKVVADNGDAGGEVIDKRPAGGQGAGAACRRPGRRRREGGWRWSWVSAATRPCRRSPTRRATPLPSQ